METVLSLLHSIQSLVSNTEKIQSIGRPPQDPQYHVDELNNFESYSKDTIKMEEDEDLLDERRHLQEMEDFAAKIAGRAAILRDGVLVLLRTTSVSQGAPHADAASSVPLLKEHIALLESELESSESRLEEMAHARNEAAASERRVRRGLYRLASGRMTMAEVLKAVEKEDNGVSFVETLAIIDGLNSRNGLLSPDGHAIVSSSDVAMSSPAYSTAVAGGSKDSPAANAEEVAQLKKSLQDIQVIADTRDKMIADVSAQEAAILLFYFYNSVADIFTAYHVILFQLRTEKEQLDKRLNSILIPKNSGNDSPGDDVICQSPLFIEAISKLGTSERRVKELESAHEKIMEKWAEVKGDLDLAKKTLEDLEEKHGRRWTELVSQFSVSDLTHAASASVAFKEESSGTNINGDSVDVFNTAKKLLNWRVNCNRLWRQ